MFAVVGARWCCGSLAAWTSLSAGERAGTWRAVGGGVWGGGRKLGGQPSPGSGHWVDGGVISGKEEAGKVSFQRGLNAGQSAFGGRGRGSLQMPGGGRQGVWAPVLPAG